MTSAGKSRSGPSRLFFLLLAAARPEDGDPAVVWAGGWLDWKIGLCGLFSV